MKNISKMMGCVSLVLLTSCSDINKNEVQKFDVADSVTSPVLPGDPPHSSYLRFTFPIGRGTLLTNRDVVELVASCSQDMTQLRIWGNDEAMSASHLFDSDCQTDGVAALKYQTPRSRGAHRVGIGGIPQDADNELKSIIAVEYRRQFPFSFSVPANSYTLPKGTDHTLTGVCPANTSRIWHQIKSRDQQLKVLMAVDIINTCSENGTFTVNFGKVIPAEVDFLLSIYGVTNDTEFTYHTDLRFIRGVKSADADL